MFGAAPGLGDLSYIADPFGLVSGDSADFGDLVRTRSSGFFNDFVVFDNNNQKSVYGDAEAHKVCAVLPRSNEKPQGLPAARLPLSRRTTVSLCASR